MENFLNKVNVKTKEELRSLFIQTIPRVRGGTVETTGLKLKNLNNQICYSLVGFNLFFRLQKIIFDLIDDLDISQIFPIIDLVNEKITSEFDSPCLSKPDAKYFNKYLLIQTMVEAGTFEDSTKCIEFIHQRLGFTQAYLSERNDSLVYNHQFLDTVSIFKNYNDKINNSIARLKSQIDEQINVNEINILDIKARYEQLANESYEFMQRNKHMLTLEYFESLEYHSYCNIKQSNNALNNTFVDLGICASGRGDRPDKTFKRIIEMLDLGENQIHIHNIWGETLEQENKDKEDLKRMFDNLDNLQPQYILVNGFINFIKDISNFGNYKVAGVAIICEGRPPHVLIATQYNDKYVTINDGEVRQIDDYINFITNLNDNSNTLGAHCGSTIPIYPSVFLFEHIDSSTFINQLI